MFSCFGRKGNAVLVGPATTPLKGGKSWKDLPLTCRFGLALLPVGLQFGSFVPLFYFSYALADTLNIPWDASVRAQPNGALWIAVFMIEMQLLQLAGILLGFSLNAMILRFGLGWSWDEIQETKACPGALTRWLGERTMGRKGAGPHRAEKHLLYDHQLDEAMRPCDGPPGIP